MPSNLVRQGDFSGGEIAPQSYGKIESAAYLHGLRTALNMLPTIEGPILNRPGTRFTVAVKDESYDPLLVPFTFADGQTFMLEIGDRYIRFIQNGAQVELGAADALAWDSVTTFPANSWVRLFGVLYGPSAAASLNQEPDLNPAVWPGPFVTNQVFEIVSPWRSADLDWLKFAQNGDVITIDCVNRDTGTEYADYELTRVSNLAWTIAVASKTPQAYFGTNVAQPGRGIGFSGTGLVQTSNLYLVPKNANAAALWDAGTVYALAAVASLIGADNKWRQYIAVQNPGAGKKPDLFPDYWRLHSISQSGAANSADGGPWAKGDFAYWVGILMVSLVDGNTQPPDASIANINTHGWTAVSDGPSKPPFWALAVDGSHPAQSDSIQITQLWKDTLGITHETLPSATYTSPTDGGTFPLATDRIATYQWGAANNAAAPAGFILFGHYVYRGKLGGVFGRIGATDATTFTFQDDGSAPDFGSQPPKGTNPFDYATGQATKTQSYPRCLTYHEQRLIQAGSMKRPQDFDGSAIGDYHRWDINTPQQDSDAFRFRPASERLEDIRSLLSLRYLLLFTGSGLWGAYGPAGQITPTGINLRRYNTNGASFLQPIAIDRTALYLTDRHRVLDANWDWRADMYVSRDVSVIARHLIEGYTITGWTYQQTPYGLLWARRNDGTLLSMTYSPGGIEAWARHTTAGTFQRVASVTEPLDDSGAFEDAVYVVVKRIINGATRRYIERFSSRIIDLKETVNADGTSTFTEDVRTCNFLDSSLQYDGRNTAVLAVRVQGSEVFVAGTQMTLAATSAYFTADMVGDEMVLGVESDIPAHVSIVGYTSNLQVTVELLSDWTPEEITAYHFDTTFDFGLAALTITGLDHLEGQSVNVLGDGAVSGPYVVAGGDITLGTPAVIVQVGLGYDSDLELLDVPTAAAEMNESSVRRMFFKVVSSRGILVGETFDIPQGKTEPRLVAPQIQQVSDGNTVPPLYTGIVEVFAPSSWNRGGRAAIRQSDPLPLTIAAAVRELVPGGR